MAVESHSTLLRRMLPISVADALMRHEPVQPESFDAVTIYFSDICGFTSLSSRCSACQVISLLNELYLMFDVILDQFDVYKVETIGTSPLNFSHYADSCTYPYYISHSPASLKRVRSAGDAYMVISGLPERNGMAHVTQICDMALNIAQSVEHEYKVPHSQEKIKIRIGIHSGPVTAGVVGNKMPRYCIFGDTVNTASRMESTSMPMRIQVTSITHDLLLSQGDYLLEERGMQDIKVIDHVLKVQAGVEIVFAGQGKHAYLFLE